MDYALLLETIIKSRNQILVVVDKKGVVTYLNDPKGVVFESDLQYAVGKKITDIFDGMIFEDSPLYKILKGQKTVMQEVRSVWTLKGNKVTYLSSSFPLLIKSECVGAIEIFEDINTFLRMSRGLNVSDEKNKEKLMDKFEFKANGTVFSLGDIIGVSQNIRELKKRIYKIADSSSSILIYGETGTGKELVAQSIHNTSYKRRKKPFIAQNCAAIPKELLESTLFGTTSGSFTNAMEKPGLFELADGGTLLLDEINSMDITLQAKMLRVLQDGTIRKIGDVRSKKVDVRIIAITNIQPLEAVQKGLLRQDLFYRLNVISFDALPLRERAEDIEPLVNHFIEVYNETLDKRIVAVTTQCMEALKRYQWPGNVRELKYMLENILSFSETDTIGIEDLPEHIRNFRHDGIEVSSGLNSKVPDRVIPTLNEAMRSLEKGLLIEALDRASGNRAEAARLMGIPRQTLNNKIIKYGIFSKHLSE